MSGLISYAKERPLLWEKAVSDCVCMSVHSVCVCVCETVCAHKHACIAQQKYLIPLFCKVDRSLWKRWATPEGLMDRGITPQDGWLSGWCRLLPQRLLPRVCVCEDRAGSPQPKHCGAASRSWLLRKTHKVNKRLEVYQGAVCSSATMWQR